MRNLPRSRPGWSYHPAAFRALSLSVLCALHGCTAGAGAPGSSASMLESAGVEPDGLPTVLVVFQAADCASVRDRLLAWNDRNERVVGVLVGPRPKGARGVDQVTVDTGIQFPVVTSRAADRELTAAVRDLGYRRTPIVLGFDSGGRLRRVEPLDRETDSLRLDAFLRDIGDAE